MDLQLEIVTPDKLVVKTEAEYIGMPGILGQFGVLPQHTPMVSGLAIGKLYYKVGATTKNVFVGGGFVEISHNRICVLAEVAELEETIDADRAKRAKERAEKRLSKQENIDYERAQLALQKALVRLSIVGE